jgi:hypothetical protein
MTTPKPTPSRAPDLGDLPAPVALLTRMVQTGIRLIPDPSTRQRCWSVYLDRLETAQLRDNSRMPWESAEQVSALPRRVMQDIAVGVIREVEDITVAQRMVTAMEKVGNDFEAAQRRNPDTSPRTGRYPPQQCARPGCGVTFIPQRPNGKYHSPGCRQAHYQMRKQAKADNAPSR